MKIGYVLRKFPVLSETFILNEILELEAQGIEVHIFSVEKPNASRYHKNLHKLKAQITYIPDLLEFKSLLSHRKKSARQFPTTFWNTLWYTLKQANPSLMLRFLQGCFLSNAAKNERITHFHAHFATRATTVACLASMISKIPYSFTAHAVDIFKESLSKKALSRKIALAAFVITVSEYNKKYLSEKFQHAGPKLYKIYNGIDLKQFIPKERLPSEPFTFLCVARIVEKKGHKFLIDACEILKNQNVNFVCKLLGAGPLQREIEKSIQEKNLQNVIEILGAQTQDEVLNRFHQSHSYILTCTTGQNGDKDGLPVAMVEALACGLPVITTPMTGNPEVIKDAYNGFLVPFENPEKTAEAMKNLIENKTLYAKLCTQARSSVERSFDIKETVKALAVKFKECTKS